MKRFSFIFRIIGVILFIYFLKTVDFKNILSALKNIDKKLFGLTIFISFSSIIFRVLRMRFFISRVNPKNLVYYMHELYLIYFTGLFFGSVTPSKVGELVKVRYIKKLGTKESMYVILADRIWDAFYIFGFAYLGLFFLGVKKLFYSMSVVGLIFLIIAFVLFKTRGIEFIKKNTPGFIKKFISPELFKHDLKSLLFINIMTILCFAVYFLWYLLLIRIAGITKVSAIQIFWIQSIIVFVNVMPVSIMGMGTREAIAFHFLKVYGYNMEDIMFFGVIVLFFYVLNIVFGFLSWNLIEHLIKRRPETYE
mgnify:FL=1